MIVVRARQGRPRPALLCVLVLAAALTGCGGSSTTSTPATSSTTPSVSLGASPLAHRTDVTLVLDFVPNAVHAGIYRALAAGYYRSLNIALRIVQPTSTSDTLKLIDAGRAQFGLADGLDIAQLIDAGGDAQSIMAIAQRPLGALIALASEHFASPADLEGRDVGITGVPSDLAVLDTEVATAGGAPSHVHVINVGFNGATALASGRLAAFTGYWADDGVQLQASGHPITVFHLEDYGGPDYPGLEMFTTRRLLSSDPALARAFVAASVRGYEDTIADPARSIDDLLALNPGLPRSFTTASLHAYLPLFDAGGVAVGTLPPAHMAALSSWMLAHGLIHHPISPARFATNAFLPAAG